MTVTDFKDSVKFDANVNQNTDYMFKNCSKDTGNSFLGVFETANKSYNFSFDKSENYQSQDLNKYSTKKEFKSDYENFYNKFENNKNIENPVKRDYAETTKKEENRYSDENNRISKRNDDSKDENKTVDKKDTNEKVSEEKQEIKDKDSADKSKNTEKEAEDNKGKTEGKAEENTDNKDSSDAKNQKKEELPKDNSKENNVAVVAEAVNLDLSTAVQNDVKNEDSSLKKEDQIKTANTSNTTSAEIKDLKETASVQKQIENQKQTVDKNQNVGKNISDKQDTEILQEVKPKNTVSLNNDQINVSDKQELKKETPIDQSESKKPEVLATAEVADKLNAVDKKLLGQQPDEKVKAASEKLTNAMENQDLKPVITNIEIKGNSSKMDFDGGQNQKQPQQEIKLNINQNQTVSNNNNNLSKNTEIQQTTQFDRVLNSKQAENIENSVLNQVKEKVSSNITANKSEITIALRPDNLGKVNINLVSKDGILTAQITAENNQVKDILSKGLENLKQNMLDQGINVGKVVINVQESSSSSNQNMNSEQNFRNFDQTNTDSSGSNYQSNKQNNPEGTSSGHSNNQLYEFEEVENNNEESVSNGENSVIHNGRVDYKV